MRGYKLRPMFWAIVSVLLLAGGFPAGPAGAGEPAPPPPADVIVIFRDGMTAFQRDQVLRRAGAVPTRHFERISAAAAHLPSPFARAALEQDPLVVGVVPDRPIQAHRKPGGGGGGGGSSQVVPEGVKRIGAAELQQTGSGVGVAVVDTGLDLSHLDLSVRAECFGAFTGACQDDNGHGTHVGGIIAARNNAIDVVGVAPEATLYAVKVLDAAGSGSDSTVMAGLDWVAQRWQSVTPHIRVVNMSLGRAGTLGDNPALRAVIAALHDEGIAVVVSAGNDPAAEVAGQVPATYPEVMAIASTTAVKGSNRCVFFSGAIDADTASYFTTDGRFDPATGIGVTVSAPGEDREDIGRNCFIQSVGILSTRLGGGTTRMSGTSMAAPHVAGVAALMLGAQSSLTAEEIRTRIREQGSSAGVAPRNSPSAAYTFDGEREGVVSAPGALLQ
jgi:subtilisin family serine protease